MPSSHSRRLPSRVILASLVGAMLVAAGVPASAHHDRRCRTTRTPTSRPARRGSMAPPRAPGPPGPAHRRRCSGSIPRTRHTADITPSTQRIIDDRESQPAGGWTSTTPTTSSPTSPTNWDPAKVSRALRQRNDQTTWDGRGLSRLAYWDVSHGPHPARGLGLPELRQHQQRRLRRRDPHHRRGLQGPRRRLLHALLLGDGRLQADRSTSPTTTTTATRASCTSASPRTSSRPGTGSTTSSPPPTSPMTHDVPLFAQFPELKALPDGGRVGAKNVVWVWCGNAAHFKDTNDAPPTAGPAGEPLRLGLLPRRRHRRLDLGRRLQLGAVQAQQRRRLRPGPLAGLGRDLRRVHGLGPLDPGLGSGAREHALQDRRPRQAHRRARGLPPQGRGASPIMIGEYGAIEHESSGGACLALHRHRART